MMDNRPTYRAEGLYHTRKNHADQTECMLLHVGRRDIERSTEIQD